MASSQFDFRGFFNNEVVSDRVLIFHPTVSSGDKRKLSQPSSAVKQRKCSVVVAREAKGDKKSSECKKANSTGDDMQDDSSLKKPSVTNGDMQDDCSLDTSDRRLHVSTAVLASHSKYFSDLLLSRCEEIQQKEVVINLPSSKIQPAIDTIEAFYNQRVTEGLSVGEMLELVMMSDLFDLGLVCKDAISRIQLLELSLEDCLRVLDLSGSVTSTEFIKPLKEHVQSKVIGMFRQFDSIRTDEYDKFSPEFLSLTIPALKIILDSNETQIQCENDVMLPLSKWVEHDEKRSWDELLPHIRFAHMTAPYIIYIDEEEDFFECEKMNNYVEDAYCFRNLKGQTELRDSLYEGKRFEKRTSYKKKFEAELKLSETGVRAVYSKTIKSFESTKFVLMGFVFFFNCCDDYIDDDDNAGVYFFLNSVSELKLKLNTKCEIPATGHKFEIDNVFDSQNNWGVLVASDKLRFEQQHLEIRVSIEI